MSAPPGLVAGAQVLVEGPELREEGDFVLADESMLRLRSPRDGIEWDVPWTDVRTVSVRVGKARNQGMPLAYALLGAVLLGSCGAMLDQIDRSTSGRPGGIALLAGVVLGGLLGWGLGKVQAVALGTAWWQPIYRIPVDVEPLEEQPLNERLAAGAVSEEERAARASQQSMKSAVAWVIILVLILLVAALCNR